MTATIVTRAAPPPRIALFLDVDGTLLEIAPTPSAVIVRPRVLRVLAELHRLLGGAVALVSGRSINQLDGLFSPLELPCAGVHGSERRDPGGRMHHAVQHAGPKLDRVRVSLVRFAATHPGTLVEDKGASLAVHFRARPDLEHAVDSLVSQACVQLAPHFRVQSGTLVRELVFSRVDKGAAVEAFLAELPFKGRLPVYIGDDLTDLDGFAAVDACGGAAIAVENVSPRSGSSTTLMR